MGFVQGDLVFEEKKIQKHVDNIWKFAEKIEILVDTIENVADNKRRVGIDPAIPPTSR